MLRLLIAFLFLLACNLLQAQEYNYKQFTVRDGLPSNTIYDIKQDYEGYIWFATDAGLSRFDGRKFVNYSSQDGLPTAEILQLLPDIKGRLWIISLRNFLSYYYKGKFYTPENDSLLKKLVFKGTIGSISENSLGEIVMTSTRGDHKYFIGADNTVTDISELIEKKIGPGIALSTSRAFRPKSHFFFNYDDSIHNNEKVFSSSQLLLEDGKLTLWLKTKFYPKKKYLVRFEEVNGKIRKIDSVQKPEFKKDFQTVVTRPDKEMIFLPPTDLVLTTQSGCKTCFTPILLGSNGGTLLVDTLNYIYSDLLLPGKNCSRSLQDDEKNIWLGTLGEGVFLLPSREYKTRKLYKEDAEINSINSDGNTIYAGGNYGRLHFLENNNTSTVSFHHLIKLSNNKTGVNRLLQITKMGADLLLSFDGFMLKYNPTTKKTVFGRLDVLKSIQPLNKDTLLVATGRGGFLVNSNTLKVIDTIFRFRTYAAIEANNAWYIGASSGLHKINRNRSTWYMGTAIPPLNNIISQIVQSSDGSLWISTLGGGVVQLKNDTLANHFTLANGLTSNNCKALYADGRFVWVGTEKGLNRIDQLHPEKPILHYTSADGLANNDIHAVYTKDKIVYVGSIEGLTSFDSTKVTSASVCYLNMQQVQVGKQIKSIDSLSEISYKENDFRFDYTGISFRSLDEITYFYRLIGLKDTWDSTRNTSLSFLALPPGRYQLQLFAVNKFGVNSKTISIPFYIKPPFWATWWFRILIACSIVGLVWWLIVRRIKQEQAKAATQNRINELEQQALRSQMNPHFIFNCLNSIQNFLLHNDFEKTNEYLTSFAHLIRQTLDNSSRESISLASEIRYLNSYLDLESMRFAHSFQHAISIDPSIDADNMHIPPMILQPYVENSIRHGLRYRQEGIGSVKVKFERRGNTLLCIVEDNGVGRKKAGELKSFMHVEYQSKGMRLTAERIEAMNRRQETPITVDVIDLSEAGNSTGTQVIVRFPNVFL
ncbi:histidine kinase [Pseudoflavitalea sp. G-6-1-2]|uniref:sensor histidine kinase n=1 Tax=Pseudoflavitalea sp. G-6-1-2 TaxID=2728841 RepID=UPI00146EBE68|nr:histidine kinase [Pseudoflavitalea sp. G-6-1-2]NML19709.1 histidine kinase [Pseudoflavitalea sp. G-6-1-2]